MNARILANFRLFIGAFIIVFAVSISAFLVFNSRPSADEYLLAPLLYGFYVDGPNRSLFESSTSLIGNYLNAVQAIVDLGWDSYLNAATFQMLPATILNLFGPWGAITQAVVLHLGVWLFAIQFSSRVCSGTLSRVTGSSILVVTLAFSLVNTNFYTERPLYGIYTLTGIRFSLYVLQALLLIGLLTWFADVLSQDRAMSGWVIFSALLFPAFAALWFSSYFLLLFPLLLLIGSARARIKLRVKASWLLIYMAIVAISIFNAKNVMSPKILAGRSQLESIGTLQTIKNFFEDIVFSNESRLYDIEPWFTVYGVHSVLAFLAGVFAYLLLRKDMLLTNSFRLINTLLTIFVTIFMVPIFVFQEYVTYVAFWHRATPATFAIVAFFGLGIRITEKILAINHSRKSVMLLTLLGAMVFPFAMVLAIDSAKNWKIGAEALVSFRSNWDAGDPFGRNSGIENAEKYTIRNFMEIRPYRHEIWRPPLGILDDIKFEIVEDKQAPDEFLIEISSSSSYFADTLGNKVSFNFVIEDIGTVNSSLGSIASVANVDSKTKVSIVQNESRFLVEGEIPLNSNFRLYVRCQNSETYVNKKCFQMSDLQKDFSQQFKAKWNLNSE